MQCCKCKGRGNVAWSMGKHSGILEPINPHGAKKTITVSWRLQHICSWSNTVSYKCVRKWRLRLINIRCLTPFYTNIFGVCA